MTVAVPMGAVERALCTTTARWLDAGGTAAAGLGLASALAAAGLWLLRPAAWPWAAAALALALAERGLALRVRFDAGLFAELAQGLSLPALDESLASLGLRRHAGPSRPLADRVAGARRLLVWHAAAAIAQLGLVVGGLLGGGVR